MPNRKLSNSVDPEKIRSVIQQTLTWQTNFTVLTCMILRGLLFFPLTGYHVSYTATSRFIVAFFEPQFDPAYELVHETTCGLH